MKKSSEVDGDLNTNIIKVIMNITKDISKKDNDSLNDNEIENKSTNKKIVNLHEAVQ